jgi:hypothetical protein
VCPAGNLTQQPLRRPFPLGDRIRETVGAERTPCEFETGMSAEPFAQARHQRGVADPALRHRRRVAPKRGAGA